MREGFYIGPLLIHYYGVLISLGILAGTWISIKMAKREGLDEEFIWDMLPWVILAGVIGARLWHVLTPPQSMVDMGLTTKYYLSHPLEAIAIWNGGLGIPGAVIGGVFAAWIISRKRKVSLAKVVDVVAPGLILAQAIGRWGNFVNQELYGMPTTLPWGIFIEPVHRLPEFANQAYYHPLFLYESIANLIIFGILIWITLRTKNRKTGMLFQVYLILYPTVRFLLEFLRLDPSHVSNFNINQTLMAVIAVSSAAVLVWRIFGKGKTGPEDGVSVPEVTETVVSKIETNAAEETGQEKIQVSESNLLENTAAEPESTSQDQNN